MKFIPRFLALTLLLVLSACMMPSCAMASIPVAAASRDIASPLTARASDPAIKLNLLGADLEQFQAAYPGGPQIAIAGLKTSPGLGLVTGTIRDAVQWGAMSKIASGWFGQKNVETTQAGLTRRAQIGADSQVRTAELNLLKPVEAAAP